MSSDLAERIRAAADAFEVPPVPLAEIRTGSRRRARRRLGALAVVPVLAASAVTGVVLVARSPDREARITPAIPRPTPTNGLPGLQHPDDGTLVYFGQLDWVERAPAGDAPRATRQQVVQEFIQSGEGGDASTVDAIFGVLHRYTPSRTPGGSPLTPVAPEDVWIVYRRGTSITDTTGIDHHGCEDFAAYDARTGKPTWASGTSCGEIVVRTS